MIRITALGWTRLAFAAACLGLVGSAKTDAEDAAAGTCARGPPGTIPNPINEDQLEGYNGHGTDGGAERLILLALSGVSV
jgi:hypothetical protein